MNETRARVLIVDDDPNVLRTVERVLQSDYDVRATPDSTGAADLAAEFRPDVALCDVQMPGLDGFELLDRLRVACPDIDVILMTGSLTDQDRHLIRALKQRAYYFILKPFEREVLITLLDRCLETRRLRSAERSHLNRIETELSAARAFQQAMLPPETASVCGVRIDSKCTMYGEVGGDFIDFTEAEGKLVFIIADARGHGVPAALLTGTVKSLFRFGARAGETPERIVSSLGAALGSFSADRFVTAFCGRYDPETGLLEYVNAGHPAALVVQRGVDHVQLASTAPLLSNAFGLEAWPGDEVELPPGARLFVYTDGLLDSARGKIDLSEERMIEPLRPPAVGADALDALLRDVDEIRRSEPPVDDVTVMLLQPAAEPAAEPAVKPGAEPAAETS